MKPEEESFYEVLGVGPEATAGEIKKAYFLLVRKFRPEENPEKFQQFNDAYATLSDPVRRREYDWMQQFGPQINPLLERAGELLEDDPAQAIRLCKQAVIIAPEMILPRRQLAWVLLNTGDYAAAETAMRRLLTTSPDDVPLRLGLSRCLWLQDKNAEAEVEARQVLAETPHDPNVYMLLSHIYWDMERPDQSAAILEDGILQNGKEDKNDVGALLALLKIHAAQENSGEAVRTVSRLYAVSPGEVDWISSELFDLALGLFHAHAWQTAWRILPHIRRNEIENPELGERLDKAYWIIGAHADAARMQADEQINHLVKRFAFACYLDSDKEGIEQRYEQITSRLYQFASEAPTMAQKAFSALAQEYPCLAENQTDFLREMNAAIQRSQASQKFGPSAQSRPRPLAVAAPLPPASSSVSSFSFGGCLIRIVGGVFLMALLPTVLRSFGAVLPFLLVAAFISWVVYLVVKKLNS